MPTNAMPETHQTRLQRDRARRLPARLSRLATDYSQAGERRGTAHDRLEDLRGRHPEFTSPNTRDVAGYLITLLAIPAVIALHALLEGPTARYLVSNFLNETSASLLRWVPLIVAVSIVVIELVLAEHRVEAQECEAKGTVRLWVVVSIALLAVFLWLLAATQLSIEGARRAEAGAPATAGELFNDPVFLLRFAAISALAVLLHMVILFGGSASRDAKSWALFRIRDAWLSWRDSRHAAKQTKKRQQLVDTYNDYVSTLATVNAGHQTPVVPPAVFDNATAATINAVFNQPVVGSAPAEPAAAEDADTPQVSPATDDDRHVDVPPATEPDGEADYLRTVLAQRVRDNDSEIS